MNLKSTIYKAIEDYFRDKHGYDFLDGIERIDEIMDDEGIILDIMFSHGNGGYGSFDYEGSLLDLILEIDGGNHE